MASTESDAAQDLAQSLSGLTLNASSGKDGQPDVGGHVADERVAGMGAALQAVRELVGWPVLHAELGAHLGVRWPRGLLLHGPPGCGKTLLVQAVAEEFGASLHVLTAASVFGAYVGEAERRLREVFEAAQRDAAAGRVAVVFLDEVDALCPRREAGRQMETRVVAQLLTLMDGAASGSGHGHSQAQAQANNNNNNTTGSNLQLASGNQGKAKGHLVVVGATNRPNALDPALRRPGRLDREVSVSVPDADQRLAILRLHTRGLDLAGDVDLAGIARSCHGYSGADLAALAREAAMQALSSTADAMHLFEAAGAQAQAAAGVTPAVPAAVPAALPVCEVRGAHFTAAMQKVGPSIVRGAGVEVPPVKWEDVGGLGEVKRRLRQAVEWPMQHADAFTRLGLSPPRGVLLHGPPGCSKTTLARAAATASGATLLPLSCAQMYSMYVGEGEALLREAFKKARLAAPSIVFLDEIDAMAAKREEGGDGAAGGPDAGVRLLATLLTEMDGLELATGVLVLAATNRPGAVDAALLRPGRFDVLLYVPPPDAAGRLDILRIHARHVPLAEDVDLAQVAERTEGMTGAELAGVVREAALAALREDLTHARHVAARHFDAALRSVRPSLSPSELQEYEAWGKDRARP